MGYTSLTRTHRLKISRWKKMCCANVKKTKRSSLLLSLYKDENVSTVINMTIKNKYALIIRASVNKENNHSKRRDRLQYNNIKGLKHPIFNNGQILDKKLTAIRFKLGP
jgi:hypothetical protein